MNRYQLLLLILMITGIYSCEKNVDELLPEYPVTFESYLISELEMKIYTKNGEIISPDLKNEIVQRFKKNLTDLDFFEIEGKVVATYLTKDTVKLTIDDIEEEHERLVYEKNGIIYWENQDTLEMGFFPYSFQAVTNYHPLYYKEFAVPTATGYSTVAKYKECFYVKKKDEGFIIPMFDFVYKSEFGVPKMMGINNEFNKDYVSLIGYNDTIIIQEYKIEMKQNSREY